MGYFAAAFPKQEIVAEVWWELVNDLDDAQFLPAMLWIIKNTPELYPGTNVIAMVRDRVFELVKRQSDSIPKLQEPRPVITGSLKDEYERTLKQTAENLSADR